MFNELSYAAFYGCTISGDVAYFGGGIFTLYSADTHNATTLNGCILDQDVALYKGGAFDAYSIGGYGYLTATGCTFDDDAASYGGAIYSGGQYAILLGVTVTGSTFNGDASTYNGGAICTGVYSFEIIGDSNFEDNSSGCGGAVFNSKSYLSNIYGSTFTDNTAVLSGGAVYNFATYARMNDCTLTGNEAPIGGAVAAIGSSLQIGYCAFSENGTTATVEGGAIAGLGSYLNISGCAFNDNSASYCGGAVLSNAGTPSEITRCTFTDNSTGGDGGAVFGAHSYYVLTIGKCTFTGDSAVDGGGAVGNSYGSVYLIDDAFNANTAGSGGAILNELHSQIQVVNSTFVGNQAGATGLGNVVLDETYSFADIDNSTFTDNHPIGAYSGGSAAVFGDESPSVMQNYLTIYNSILWNDAGAEVGGNNSKSVPTVVYSDINQNGFAGSYGDIDANPQFGEAPDLSAGHFGNLALQGDSPCINAGNNGEIAPGAMIDLAGNLRIANGTVDMGAYEYQTDAIVLYVQAGATGMGNGTSWTNAFPTLWQALDQTAIYLDASPYLTVEIKVAQGTYYPTDGADRTASFQLMDNVGIFGGFAGIVPVPNPPDPNTFDPSVYVTILSGNIGSTDNSANFSFHVVNGSGTNSSALLFGVTIEDGNADGTGAFQDDGGGVFNYCGTPTLDDCIIEGDHASNDGGGIYNCGGWSGFYWSPIIDDCRIGQRETYGANFVGEPDTAGNDGGGIFNYNQSPWVNECSIDGDSAGNNGGGVYNYGPACTPTFSNCQLYGDHAANDGGGMSDANQAAGLVAKCSFYYDHAGNHGGGMNVINAAPTVLDCQFGGDGAQDGGGMAIQLYDLHGVGVYMNVADCYFFHDNADGSNTDIQGDGGGIFISMNYAFANITGCKFKETYASNYGGGMDVVNSAPAIYNCYFRYDTAEYGGGIAIQGDCCYNSTVGIQQTIIDNCFIKYNSSSSGGDELFFKNNYSYTTVENCDILDTSNHTPIQEDNSSPLFINCGSYSNS